MSDQETNLTNESTTVETQQPQGGQTIIINQAPVVVKRNGLGVAGFVLALIGLIFSWVPVFGWIMFGLGFIFSFIGVFKAPRGLAIAGLVISIVSFIILLVFATALAALL